MPAILKLLAFYALESTMDELLPRASEAASAKVQSLFRGWADGGDDGIRGVVIDAVGRNYEAVWKGAAEAACAYSYPQWAATLQHLRTAAARRGIDVSPYPDIDQATYASFRSSCDGQALHTTAPPAYKAAAGALLIGGAMGVLLLLTRR